MSSPLEKEFDFYIANQNELVKKYKGKFIVIKNRRVIGSYNSEKDALIETQKNHALGTFLIQKCTSGPESYTITLHSRVALA